MIACRTKTLRKEEKRKNFFATSRRSGKGRRKEKERSPVKIGEVRDVLYV